ncbi:MAG: bifunctional nuclease family protein [Nitrospirota bacterium]
MNIPVKVYAILPDPNTEAQVVLLRDEQHKLLLPIWVGATEASAIRLTMENVAVSRPLTHDLLKEILGTLHFRLDKAIINNVNGNTYYAALYLEEVAHDKPAKGGLPLEPKKGQEPSSLKSFEIDARPSDAIALSLRYGAPLYVTESVFNQKEPQDDLTEWLSRLHPKDFGSFYNA